MLNHPFAAQVGTFLYSPRLGFRVDAEREERAKDPQMNRRRDVGVSRFDFYTTAKGMESLFVAATANTWFSWVERLEAHDRRNGWRSTASWAFWGSYILVARYLFLNLCTLVVLYKYERINNHQPWVAMDEVAEVRSAWQRFDRFGSGEMETRYLSRFLRLLPPPLGVPRDAPRLLADRHAVRVLLALPQGLLGFEEHGEGTSSRGRDRRWRAVCDGVLEAGGAFRAIPANRAPGGQDAAVDGATALPEVVKPRPASARGLLCSASALESACHIPRTRQV